MIPDQFYMSGLGFGIYLVLYLPVILVFLWSLWRKVKLPLVGVVPIGLVIATLPFWDVYMTSLDASRLCKEQGGLHVYKTVEAEGFWGGGAEYWLKYGFNYMEGGGGKYMSRYTLKNGEVNHQYVDSFISKYAVGTGDDHKVITRRISRTSDVVIDRKTKEILGDFVVFGIYPGWFDSLTLGWAGSIGWSCGDRYPSGKKMNFIDLVNATIKPRNVEGAKQ